VTTLAIIIIVWFAVSFPLAVLLGRFIKNGSEE
jgi:hypothetical protein